MQRKPSQTAAFLPQRAQPAARSQPQPLDPKMFRSVTGGSPKGGWLTTESSTLSPKGGG
jgi:hypothetical protein